MAENKKKKLPLSIFEIVAYSLCFLMGVWGIVYISLGIAANFARYDSALRATDLYLRAGTKDMGFLLQGVLILAIAVVVAVVILLIFARNADRDYEKAQRRAALRKARTSANEEVVVDAEVTPAE